MWHILKNWGYVKNNHTKTLEITDYWVQIKRLFQQFDMNSLFILKEEFVMVVYDFLISLPEYPWILSGRNIQPLGLLNIN